jgi:hypothetical protein
MICCAVQAAVGWSVIASWTTSMALVREQHETNRTASPARDVRKVQVDDSRIRVLSAEEIAHVATDAPPHLALICRVTLECLPLPSWRKRCFADLSHKQNVHFAVWFAPSLARERTYAWIALT